jgi:GntR family transcriptional regulator
MAAYKVPTPKYLRVLNTLRERIEDGTYAPGTALPSESQISTEFAVSRSSVLKALGILRQDDWIESHQGRGHFVRGRMPRECSSPAYAREAVDIDESAHAEMLHVGPVLATPRIADVLGIPDGTPVYERRRRTIADSGPIDLVTTFVPVEIGVGTDVPKPDPVPGSLLEHIELRKGVRADYAQEWLTARAATPEEAKALDIEEAAPVLSILIAVHQASGESILATTLVMPGSRHEIEDTYPVR